MHDLVIRGGTIIDGSGETRRIGDVAIDGDAITEVGEVDGRGRREIDADGLLVTPGWVDMHTHYDAQATWDPELTPSGWHGVTTVVAGNCGVGFAPAAADRRDWLIGLMEGVEDIPGAAMHEGIQWEWETFPEYLDALDRRSWVMDIGTQLPHGSVRAYVMGERGASNEDATVDDIAAMADITTEALRAGALGFSTSRTPLHKSVDGVLVPGTTADTDELIGIADAMAAAGHGVFQCAVHHPDVPGSFEWFRAIAAITGKPVTFNFVQTDQSPELWAEVMRHLEAAAADGLTVTGQVAGRPVGVLQSWLGSINPFMAKPAFKRIAGLDWPELLHRLRQPETRAAILGDETPGPSRFADFITTSWNKMWPMVGDTDYEPEASTSFAARAEAQRCHPAELAYDHMLTADGTGIIYFPLFNYSDGSLDVLRQMHAHPQTRMGLSDAGAHCASICDGAMPTFMLSFWGRDRERGETLDLEHLVARQTRRTAAHYGMHDRGLLAPGMRADVNLIDFDALGADAPRMAFDFPMAAKRYIQPAHGYRMTLCRGEVVAEDGEFTGARPGRLVRGPQHI